MADAENAAPLAAAEPQAEVQAQPEAKENAAEGQVPQEGQEVKAQPETKEELKQEVKAQLKKLNIKVDGKQIEKEINLADEAELIKMLQMAELSQKRAQEAAELRKAKSSQDAELNQFLNTLKSNPEFILQQMGIDPAKFAEEVLTKEVEKMQLSPEQRKIQELEKELKAIKDNEEKAKKDKEEIQAKALRDKYAADYEKQLLDAMQTGKLPNNPYVINKMVDYMSLALKEGIDVNFSDIVPLIHEDMKGQAKGLIQGMSVEDVLQMLSEQTVNDIVLKKMPKEKKKAPPTAQQVVETSKEKKEDTTISRRTGSAKDFFNKMMYEYADK